jgi:class 3 adenylate cyclase
MRVAFRASLSFVRHGKSALQSSAHSARRTLAARASTAPRSALPVPPRQDVEVNLALTESTTDDSLEGERKTVTVLFADIKGSMELMEDLDPAAEI